MFMRAHLRTVVIVACGLAACGGPEDYDLETEDPSPIETGESTSAIGEATCANFGIADSARFTGFNYTSPTTYSNPSCYKAAVADAYLYDTNVYESTIVNWEGPYLANSRSQCEALLLRADLYVRLSTRYLKLKTVESRGRWSDGCAPPYICNPGCTYPRVKFKSEFYRGSHYRITATARTYNSGAAPTQPVSIRSYEPANIR